MIQGRDTRRAAGTGLLWLTLLVAGDVLFLNTAYLLAFVLRFGPDVPAFNLISYVVTAPWLTLAVLVLNSVYGLYNLAWLGSRPWREQRPAVISSSLMTFLLGVTLSFFLRGFSFPRTVLVLAVFVHLVSFYVWRRAVRRLVPGQPVQRVALVVSPDEGAAVWNHLAQEHGEYHQVLHLEVAGEAESAHGEAEPEEIIKACLEAGAEVILLGASLESALRNRVARTALASGLRVLFVPSVDDIWLASSELRQAGDLMMLEAGVRYREGDGLKRLLDVAAAAFGLLVMAPVMALVAAAVRLSSPGPVLFVQERVGFGGRPFQLYKFRTMRQDAESATGPVLSPGLEDPRVTRLGRFLRASRLDELPQLWNVLRGDMSLVGPRPERPYFVEQFSQQNPAYPLRHQAKVGVTGLAQVSGRYSTTPEDKLRYDLYYVNARSIWLDLTILLRTLETVLTRSKSA